VISPAREEQIDLAEEPEHRRDSTQRQQAEAEAQGDQRILLVETGVIGDAVTAGAQREQNDAGERPQIHEQVGRHVEHHRRIALLGSADEADHHEAGLTDRAVGQHPLHRGLGQGDDVAEHHAQHGQHGEQELPLGIEAGEAAHQDPQRQGEAGGLGAH